MDVTALAMDTITSAIHSATVHDNFDIRARIDSEHILGLWPKSFMRHEDAIGNVEIVEPDATRWAGCDINAAHST